MANVFKKLIKQKSDLLEANEEYLGATYAQPAGSFAGVAGGFFGGVAGGFAAGRAAKERKEALGGRDEIGIAGEIPDKHIVLAVTNQRLLIFGFNHLRERPRDLLGWFPIDRIRSMDVTKRTAHKSLNIGFSDGSVADFDLVYGSTPDSLLSAFEGLNG